MWPTAQSSQGERVQPARLHFTPPLLATVAGPEYQQLPHVWMFIDNNHIQWALLLVSCQPAVGQHLTDDRAQHFDINADWGHLHKVRRLHSCVAVGKVVLRQFKETVKTTRAPKQSVDKYIVSAAPPPPSQIFAHLLLCAFLQSASPATHLLWLNATLLKTII